MPEVPWSGLAADRPDLAEAGRALLYQFGVGLAFLGTVRKDGGPRVHPFSPVLEGSGLYALLIPSPKRDDLQRDERYAMHSFPADDSEDAFSLRGSARPVVDAHVRRSVEMRYAQERSLPAEADLAEHEVFEFLIERCLLTRTSGHGDVSPRHEIWRVDGGAVARGGRLRS